MPTFICRRRHLYIDADIYYIDYALCACVRTRGRILMDPDHLSNVVASAVSRAINEATRSQPPATQPQAPYSAPRPPAPDHRSGMR